MSRNFAGGDRVVTRDQDDLNARRLAVGDGLWNFRAQGVGQANQTQPLKDKVVWAFRVVDTDKAAACHGQHAQPLCGHVRYALQPVCALGTGQVAQVHDGLGRAFG